MSRLSKMSEFLSLSGSEIQKRL